MKTNVYRMSYYNSTAHFESQNKHSCTENMNLISVSRERMEFDYMRYFKQRLFMDLITFGY